MTKETEDQESQDLPEEKEVDREEEIYNKVRGCGFVLMGFITILIILILLFVQFYL